MRQCSTVLCATLLLVVGGCGGGPEDELSGHVESLTEIMEDNMDSPEDGVDEIRDYVESNLPAAASAIADALVELNRIEDRGERKERLEEMLDELEGPLKAFKQVADKFGKKVEADAGARRKAERLMKDWKAMEDVFEEFERKLKLR